MNEGGQKVGMVAYQVRETSEGQTVVAVGKGNPMDLYAQLALTSPAEFSIRRLAGTELSQAEAVVLLEAVATYRRYLVTQLDNPPTMAPVQGSGPLH